MQPVYAGKLSRRIEFFKEVKELTPTGERDTQMQSLGKRYAERRELQAKEVEEGKLIAHNSCMYIVRYSKILMQSGVLMYLQDFDGMYRVTGVQLFQGNGRKRFLQLKCEKYATDFDI